MATPRLLSALKRLAESCADPDDHDHPGAQGHDPAGCALCEARAAIVAAEKEPAAVRKDENLLATGEVVVTGTLVEWRKATWGYAGGDPPEPAYVEDLAVKITVGDHDFFLLDYSKTDDLIAEIEAALFLDALEPDGDPPRDDD